MYNKNAMNISLREWKRADAADLAVAINNKKVLDNVRDGIPFPYTVSDAEEFINAMLNAEKGSRWAFAIAVDDKAIGSIGAFRRANIHSRTAEIGYYIAEPYWGQGITTSAVQLLCKYIFENTDIIRIFAEPFAHNTASCRVLEKSGFVFEGTLRQNAVKNGNIIDMRMYSLTRKSPLSIRQETADDYAAILPLTYEAFLTLDLPGRTRTDEHYLIYLLQGSKYLIPELCFVAERDGEIVGHILYTKSKIIRTDGSETETITFGPLSVLPKYHRQGIGSALVRHSLKKAGEMGFGAVLITGVPDYYPKLGFKRARDFGLTLEDGTSADSFMAYELVPSYLSGGGVLHFLSPEFEISERSDGEFEKFHTRFIASHIPVHVDFLKR